MYLVGFAVIYIVPSCSILLAIEFICSILTISAISYTSYALPIHSLKNERDLQLRYFYSAYICYLGPESVDTGTAGTSIVGSDRVGYCTISILQIISFR